MVASGRAMDREQLMGHGYIVQRGYCRRYTVSWVSCWSPGARPSS